MWRSLVHRQLMRSASNCATAGHGAVWRPQQETSPSEICQVTFATARSQAQNDQASAALDIKALTYIVGSYRSWQSLPSSQE